MLCQKSLLTTVNLKTILQIQSHRLLATTIVPIQYRSVVRNGDTCKSMSFSTTRDKPSPDGTSASSMMGWPSIILYGDLNMRPFRNVWMLEEIGLPYRHIPCRPWSRLSKSVHPLGKVPSLVVEYQSCDSGANEDTFTGSSNDAGNKIVVLESAAINTFLGDLAREKVNNHQHEGRNANIPVLVPPPATLERAKYDSLAFFIMTEIDSQSLWIHRKHSDLSEIFGAAPTAVTEAKRQFDNAMKAMESEVSEGEYLIPSLGFSGADILFANCCFWAQQNEWLEKVASGSMVTNNQNDGANGSSDSGKVDTKISTDDEVVPFQLSTKLEAYLKRCRSRPGFLRANELRKNQIYEKKKQHQSRL